MRSRSCLFTIVVLALKSSFLELVGFRYYFRKFVKIKSGSTVLI